MEKEWYRCVKGVVQMFGDRVGDWVGDRGKGVVRICSQSFKGVRSMFVGKIRGGSVEKRLDMSWGMDVTEWDKGWYRCGQGLVKWWGKCSVEKNC